MRHEGTVDFWSIKKGYGFILDSTDDTTRFFHHTEYRSVTLAQAIPQVGRKVTFEPAQNSKGLLALNVEVDTTPESAGVGGGL